MRRRVRRRARRRVRRRARRRLRWGVCRCVCGGVRTLAMSTLLLDGAWEGSGRRSVATKRAQTWVTSFPRVPPRTCGQGKVGLRRGGGSREGRNWGGWGVARCEVGRKGARAGTDNEGAESQLR